MCKSHKFSEVENACLENTGMPKLGAVLGVAHACKQKLLDLCTAGHIHVLGRWDPGCGPPLEDLASLLLVDLCLDLRGSQVVPAHHAISLLECCQCTSKVDAKVLQNFIMLPTIKYTQSTGEAHGTVLQNLMVLHSRLDERPHGSSRIMDFVV